MFTDKTELAEEHQRVENTVALNTELFERAGVALSVLDARGRIQEANADFGALAGRTAAALASNRCGSC